MKCVNCPYIQEQLKDRIETALRYDGFIPDYKSAEYEDVDYCYCEKVGHKLYAGRCSDAEYMDEDEWFGFLYCNGFDLSLIGKYDDDFQPDDTINDTLKETKKQKKRRRNKKHFRRQLRIYDALKRWYPTPMWPRYKNDEWWRDEGERGEILYFRTSHHNRYKQWLKKQSNKKIRRTKGVPKRGKGFKKFFDLWWELW